MGRNGKSLMGIPWEWELVKKLGMGMGRNGNLLHGNGREWECKKPFPGISITHHHHNRICDIKDTKIWRPRDQKVTLDRPDYSSPADGLVNTE